MSKAVPAKVSAPMVAATKAGIVLGRNSANELAKDADGGTALGRSTTACDRLSARRELSAPGSGAGLVIVGGGQRAATMGVVVCASASAGQAVGAGTLAGALTAGPSSWLLRAGSSARASTAGGLGEREFRGPTCDSPPPS